MRIRRSGFTMIELLVVLIVGAVVLGVSTRQFSTISNERAVVNAANAVIQTANRARSEAMRSGKIVYLEAVVSTGLVRVDTASTTLHTLDLNEYGVSMSGTDFTVCYSARGYALPGCTTVDSGVLDVTLARGAASEVIRVMPLGQIRRLQ